MPTSLRRELFYGSGTHLVLSGVLVFTTATQEIPLDHQGLVARSTCILGSLETVTIRDRPWQATSPTALHRQQTEINL